MSTQAQTGEARKIVLPGQTPEGQYILSVLVKRTYSIVPGRACVRADHDGRLVAGDVHYDDPMNSSVRFESDFVPFKLATDVVVNGRAHVPDGQVAEQILASVILGNARTNLLVTGDRVCAYDPAGPPIFGDPQPFKTMELRYERAYGGVDIKSDPHMPCIYARNHLGRGFVIANTHETIDGLELPNIEDPDNPLTPGTLITGHFMHWEQQPMPRGFGWFAKFWQPRASLAGVMPADRLIEQELRKVFAQAVPEHQRELYEQTQLPDMDFRFFNGASEGMVFPYLRGDEEITLLNLDPSGELMIRLPGERPHVGLDIGMGVSEPRVVLHTVMIRLEEHEVDLVWRGAVSYPGPDWLPEMTKMEVLID